MNEDRYDHNGRGAVTAVYIGDEEIPLDNRLEILGLLQEECAEVIQAVSKVRRTGFDFKPFNGNKTNLQLLTEEVQDVLVLLELMDMEEVDPAHRKLKLEKLHKWSNIFK